MRVMTRWIALVVMAVVATCGVARGEGDAGGVGGERWYVIQLQGAKAGWMMERTSEGKDGRYTTETEMRLKIGRGAQAVEMVMGSTIVEEADGQPVSAKSRSKQGQMQMSREYRFMPTKIVERVVQGDEGDKDARVDVNVLEIPEGDWFMPAAGGREADRLRESGAEEYTIRMLDTSMGLMAVDVTTRVLGETVVGVFGKKVPAVEHEVLQSAMPGVVTREYVGLDGEMVRTTVALGPGMELTVLAADRAVATSEFDAPELMASTLVKPSRAIENARESTRGVYVLRVPDGKMPELVSGGGQQHTQIDDQSTRVEIAWRNPSLSRGINFERYLAATSAADKDDPEIIRLVKEALRGQFGRNEIKRVDAMRKYVHKHITGKDLSVGFATASEVCRTGEGDCSEHAVLLAAMLRADGIPSRVVSGLIYVDSFLGKEGVFGYHMWTQFCLENQNGFEGTGRWFNVDATLPNDMWTDATHIALSTSDLSDEGTMNTMVALGGVLGQLEIEVIEVE